MPTRDEYYDAIEYLGAKMIYDFISPKMLESDSQKLFDLLFKQWLKQSERKKLV